MLDKKVEKVISDRRATEELKNFALEIVKEVNHAWAFPEDNTELSKVGSMGYMAEVGSPHQWWEDNCKAYKATSDSIFKDRDLNTVCLIATTMLSN
jgi:hypothetical protein